MKNAILAAAIGAMMCGTAAADDYWSGPYAGIFGSGSLVHHKFTEGAGLGSVTSNHGDYGGGVFAGWNWQSGMMVYGVEGEAGYNGHSETVVGIPGPGALTSDIGFNGSVRARLGHQMGMALPFVSAGVAVARLDSDWPGMMNRSATLVGGVAGIGVDYLFTDKVFGRAAYDFTFYGNKTIQYCPGCLMRNSISTHTFKIGVGVNLN